MTKNVLLNNLYNICHNITVKFHKKSSTSAWAGDQNVDFSYGDGLATTIPAALRNLVVEWLNILNIILGLTPRLSTGSECRVLTKISVFNQIFLAKIEFLSLAMIVIFWLKFRFLTKISIFDQNFDFWPYFRFILYQNNLTLSEPPG